MNSNVSNSAGGDGDTREGGKSTLFQEQKNIAESFKFILQSKQKDVNRKLGKPGYEYEDKKFAEINDIVKLNVAKAVAVGVCTFALLRLSTRHLRRGRGVYPVDAPSSQARSPFDAINKNIFSSTNNGKNQGGGSGMEHKPSFFRRSIGLYLELGVSCFFASNAYMNFSSKNSEKRFQKYSEFPLVQGRSTFSDVVCLDLRREYSHYSSQDWQHLTKESTAMTSIHDLVANCRKREKYERQIREEMGVYNEEEHVPIPSPGVPTDLDISDTI